MRDMRTLLFRIKSNCWKTCNTKIRQCGDLYVSGANLALEVGSLTAITARAEK